MSIVYRMTCGIKTWSALLNLRPAPRYSESLTYWLLWLLFRWDRRRNNAKKHSAKAQLEEIVPLNSHKLLFSRQTLTLDWPSLARANWLLPNGQKYYLHIRHCQIWPQEKSYQALRDVQTSHENSSKNFKVVLNFSPSGDNFRTKVEKYKVLMMSS